jgi:hypothetical protein
MKVLQQADLAAYKVYYNDIIEFLGYLGWVWGWGICLFDRHPVGMC